MKIKDVLLSIYQTILVITGSFWIILAPVICFGIVFALSMGYDYNHSTVNSVKGLIISIIIAIIIYLIIAVSFIISYKSSNKLRDNSDTKAKDIISAFSIFIALILSFIMLKLLPF